MAPFPEEVDVFTGPHWRMKHLVGVYCEKLSKTNFSNNNDFRSFLRSLCDTFKEFKMHEQIENEYIIGLLQQRCRTIYNVHSDNKLSEMLSLFEKGLKNVKNEYEQLNYAKQLKERLEEFTQDFLPHMKEEEEVFQPMLMEYFTYEELKDIKKVVIAQHSSQRSWDTMELLKGLSLWNQAEELHKVFKYSADEKVDEGFEKDTQSVHVSHLPPEVILKVFRYLSPVELCRCSQVCTDWSELTKTGSLWKHLHPVHWARGDYYSCPPGELDLEPDDDWVKNREDESKAYQEWDEDADIDESEEAAENSPAVNIAQREKHLLNGMIKNLLPVVGLSVKSLILAYSSALSSKMIRQMLELCPNLTHLDLTQTDITDSAFDSWSTVGSCQALEHLDLSGCEKITDVALEKLSKALGDLTMPDGKEGITKNCQNNCAKILKAHQQISLQASTECGLRMCGHQTLLFKGKPGSAVSVSSRVWVINRANLVDIEDAAEWRQTSAEGLRLVDAPPAGSTSSLASCCCRNNNRGLRTSAYRQQLTSPASSALCGHSFCCSDTALRTIETLPEPSALCNKMLRTRQTEEKDMACSGSEKRTNQPKVRRALKFLSLSGCYQITDLGLRALSLHGGLPRLEHLNLSGCLFITEVGLQELVSACPALNDEHFYYCDNINGPHADTASGCQNLQCGFRACCRSGE
ncbi:FBXL5 protein, partial [Polyodon spathula]|nr:F-box/LRR-repeat protein 5-like [Polyodon spathula]MBN3276089.1 FBXL5 protein [Polyodon spathula]